MDKLLKQKKVWGNTICFTLLTGFSHLLPLTVDKTIATHTNLTISKPYKHKVWIYQWWGATAIIFTAFQICEICYKKIISITPFV